ncbi:MAG: hypothetical protein NC133_04155 [Prevotella sp.]|nr:hypothetical protein [Prevotella sp.]
MMKKFMQKLLQMTTVLALVVLVGVTMAACGGNDSDQTDESSFNPCNIDNLEGYYANIEEQKLYYFEKTSTGGLSGLPGEFSLVSEEPDENGLYHLRVTINYPAGGKYAGKLQVNRGANVVSIYHQWTDNNPGVDDLLIGTYQNDYDKDLSKQFYAEDEKIIYTKISGLDEFLTTVFPDKEIDTADTSHVVSYDWKNLIAAL